MTLLIGRAKVSVAAMTTVFALGACDDFLAVENPNVINADAINAAQEISMLSHSARQEWARTYAWMVIYTAFFTHEAWVSETGTLPNAVGRREVNTFIKDDYIINLGDPIGRAIAAADRVIHAAEELPNPGHNLDVARAYFTSGFTMVIMGENFCQGVIAGGPALSPEVVLDSAAARLSRAREISIAAAPSLSGPERVEALDIANAALVGRARAHLQVGRLQEALTDAQQVPEGFEFSVKYVDVPGSRDRLSNKVYEYSWVGRLGLSVAPAFRTMNDPRVPVVPPEEHGLTADDGTTEYWAQAKYTSYDSPIRLASKLEADYIAAEASGTQAMLELIQERRAAVGLGPYDGPTDAEGVLIEFLDQRSREFFMEVKRLGDSRRHPGAVPYIPEPGSPFHKAGFGPIGDDTCWPQPDKEVLNNENMTA